jgi:ribosomal protein S18 acetylase RimI-like enzyme
MRFLRDCSASLALDFREMTEKDLDFVESLYATTRADELGLTGWPEEQQRAFLAQQHGLQHRAYRSTYPEAHWLIIEQAGKPIGRLYLAEQPGDLRIIDISLVPAGRGRGIGEAIIRDLLACAQAAGISVSLHVEQGNRARRLYERLGFRIAEDRGAYLLLVSDVSAPG